MSDKTKEACRIINIFYLNYNYYKINRTITEYKSKTSLYIPNDNLNNIMYPQKIKKIQSVTIY